MPETRHRELLTAVIPLFLSDVEWRCNGSIEEERIVRNMATLLKVYLLEIPLYMGGNLTDQQIEIGHNDQFEYLLQDLESLLSGEILNEKITNQDLPESDVVEKITTTSPSLRETFPKLVHLSSLINDLSKPQRFLLLNQKPLSLKRTCYHAELLAKRLKDTQNENLATANPIPGKTGVPARSTTFESRFWRCSSHLFNALQIHLEPCAKRKSRIKHRALLHLKGYHASEQRDPHPRLNMRLASCSDSQSWPEVHCTVSDWEITSRTSRAHEQSELVTDICEDADYFDNQNRIFKIDVRGSELIKLSALDDDDIVEHPEANPSKSLSCLIKSNFMNNPYRFPEKHKRYLAFNLAWNLLQLHEGPWIQTNWTSDCLLFMFGTDEARVYNIHQPYVNCSLTSDSKYESEINDPMHKYPLVLCFGRVLMEIEKGEIIHTTETTKKGAPDLLATLQKRLKGWKEDLNADYVSAIEACLKFQKLLSGDKGTDAFRRAFLENVVAPLEREMNRFPKTEFGSRHLEWESKTLMTGSGEVPPSRPLPQPIRQNSVSLGSAATYAHAANTSVLPLYERKYGQEPRISPSRGVAMFSDYDASPSENKQRTAKTFLEKLERFRKQHIHRLTESTRVKIAVLDTGLQDQDAFIRQRRRSAKKNRRADDTRKRDPIQGTKNFTESPGHDEDGHGTDVVALLLTVAPEADIYVGKISSRKTVGINDQQISKALRWAVDEVKADIISMSFGFDNDSDWRHELRKAIKHADNADKVVFAAASNYGGNRKRTYPAKSPTVFCIHAADGDGNPSGRDPTPVERNDNFSTLGVLVPCRFDGDREIFKTGTSYATPVAAGIAANIMDLADWLHSRGELTMDQRNNLRAYEGMRGVFRQMAEARQGYDYVAPWHLWDGNADERTVWGKIRACL